MPCCSQVNGLGSAQVMTMLNGLGFADPATIGVAINSAVVHAQDLWEDIKAIFGIGAGAREADAIVPTQNTIVATVIAPVSEFLNAINTGQYTPTCQELKNWQTQVINTEKKWLDFLHNTEWQDGRAAQQAEATLAPYWTNAKTDLAKYVTQYCGVIGGGGIPTPIGNISWPMIALAAGAVYMISKRR